MTSIYTYSLIYILNNNLIAVGRLFCPDDVTVSTYAALVPPSTSRRRQSMHVVVLVLVLRLLVWNPTPVQAVGKSIGEFGSGELLKAAPVQHQRVPFSVLVAHDGDHDPCRN